MRLEPKEGKKETEPKRYTYLFGKGETSRTAADRFEKLKGKSIYLADLFEAFNVEKLNKEFFNPENEMLQVFDTFKDLSIKDRNQIQNEYWNISNNTFQLEAYQQHGTTKCHKNI